MPNAAKLHTLLTQNHSAQPNRFQHYNMTPITIQDYTTVSQLNPKDAADVVGAALPDKILERLAGMGLNMGARCTLIQGDRWNPYIVAVDETRIVLGRELADKIYVKKVVSG